MAEKDLVVLDRVYARLISTSEAQLGTVLNALLPRLLDKLSSTETGVREKTIEILTHITKRLKSDKNIPVPCKDLLDQITSSTSSSFTRNFALIFLDIGFSRMDKKSQASLYPLIFIAAYKSIDDNQKDTLLYLSLVAMESSEGHPPDESMNPFLACKEAVEVACDFFMDIMLYRRPSKSELESLKIGEIFVPPGLSEKAAQRILKKHGDIPSTEIIVKWKLGIIKLLSTATLPQSLSYPILEIGCSDIFHEVVFKAEGGVKRVGKIDYEDSSLINLFYELYLGGGKDKRTMVNENIKLRILSIFSKSVFACNLFPNTIKVVFDSIFSPVSSKKLRISGLQFTIWVINAAKPEIVKVIGPILLPSIVKFLSSPREEDVDKLEEGAKSEEGISKPATFYPSCKHREAAYTICSVLSSKDPTLFCGDLNIVNFLFSCLSNEEATVKLTVQQVLSVVGLAYIHSNDEIKSKLSFLLLENINNEDTKIRRCSVEWTCAIFPFSHIPSRFLCISLCGDSMPEVREVAIKGLTNSSTGKKKGPVLIYPNAIDLLKYIQENSSTFVKNDSSNIVGRINIKNLSDLAIKGLLVFIDECLHAKSKEDNFTNFEDYIKHQLTIERSVSTLHFYCQIIDHALERKVLSGDSLQMTEAAGISLLSIISASSIHFRTLYLSRVEFFLPILKSTSLQLRENIATIIPLVLEGLSTTDIVSFINVLHLGIQEREGLALGLDGMHGYILSLGNVIAAVSNIIPQTNTSQSILLLVQHFDHRVAMIKGASCDALAAIGVVGPLMLSKEEKDNLIVKLALLAASKDNKNVEKAAIALGYCAFGERDVEVSKKLLEGVFNLCDNVSEEVQLATGQSLAKAASNNILTEYVFNKIMNEYFISPKPAVRRATAIWLLALVKFTSTSPFIQDNLTSIQVAFTSMLNDKNDLVQECAGKGLALLYQCSSGDKLKKDLLHSLVNTLTTGVRTAVTGASTDIYGGGEVAASVSNATGVTQDSSGPNTYSELCSMVNDMGNPDLIYKFLSLSSHHSLWNSRRGATFGLGELLRGSAKEALEPYLKTILPKLFRYQYDPSEKIKESMTTLWLSLVDEPRETMTKYFDEFLKDLLITCSSNKWRERQSSSLAIADLISGRDWAVVKPYIEELWVMLLRTFDDIKDSVREAAALAVNVLAKASIRLCDPSLSTPSEAKEAAGIILPYLLNRGIVHDAKECQAVCLDTLLKITKICGNVLKPLVSEMAIVLLKSLSALESASMNYMMFHTSKIDLTPEQLEKLRVSAASSSPMQEALDICMKQAGDEEISSLLPKLVELVTHGVGLNTRVGGSKLLVNLIEKYPLLVEPISSKLMMAIIRCHNDRSLTLRKEFSIVAAHLSKISSDAVLQSLVKHYCALVDGDTSSRYDSAYGLFQLHKYGNAERNKLFVSLYLPLSFMGRYDDDVKIKDIWTELWNENTSSLEGGILLYTEELVSVCINMFKSQQWILKRTAAQALTDIIKSRKKEIQKFNSTLFPCLVALVPGFVWDGKEAVIETLATLCSFVTVPVDGDSTKNIPLLPEIITLLLTEVSKSKDIYQRASLTALSTLTKSQTHYNSYPLVSASILQLATLHLKALDHDSIEGEEENKVDFILQACAIEVIGSVWPLAVQSSSLNLSHASELVEAMFSCFSAGGAWTIRVAALKTLALVFSKISPSHCDAKLISVYVDTVYNGLSDSKYSAVRESALSAIIALYDRKELFSFYSSYIPVLTLEVKKHLRDGVPRVMELGTICLRKLESNQAGDM